MIPTPNSPLERVAITNLPIDEAAPKSDVRPYGISRMDLPSRTISGEEFGQLFKSYKLSAWRLELLTAYAIPSEDPEFKAFVEGAPIAPVSRDELCGDSNWCKLIRGHLEAGRSMGRVHVLPERLTPYLKYEIEWGYTFNNNAGDDIKLLPAASISNTLRERLSTFQDFWLFDDSKIVLCDYSPTGAFDGAREVTDPSVLDSFKSVQSACIDQALDFRTFLRAYRAGQIN